MVIDFTGLPDKTEPQGINLSGLPDQSEPSSVSQWVQGEEPSILDKVRNVFHNTPKEKAKATLALVDAEILGINPDTAYRHKDALDKYYDIDPERKQKKKQTLEAIKKFNDTGTEDGWGETIWKNVRQVPLRMQAAGGRIIQMLEESFSPEQIEASLGGMSNDEAVEVFKRVADAREEKNIRSIGREFALKKEQQAEQLAPNIMPGSAKDVVGSATQSTLNNIIYLIPGMKLGKAFSLMSMGTQAFGESYGEQREAGQEPGKAAMASGIKMVSEIATEFIPTGIYLKPKTSFIKRLIEAEFSEIPGESVNQMVNDVVDKVTIRPDMTLQDAIENIQKTIQITALSTLGLSGMTHSVNKAIAKSLPDGEIKETFNGAKNDSLEKGATPQEAMKAGIDAVNTIPEGKAFVEKKVEDIRQEFQQIISETQTDETDLDTEIDRIFTDEQSFNDFFDNMPSELRADALLEGEQGESIGEAIQTQQEEAIVPERSILDNLKQINDMIGEKGSIDLEPLIDIGRTVWHEGKQTYEEFVTRIKEIAGDIWDKIEPHIKTVWNTLANERGNVKISSMPLNEGPGKSTKTNPTQPEGGKEVYHGTKEKFSQLDIDYIERNTTGIGFTFTDSKSIAEAYAKDKGGDVIVTKRIDPSAKFFDFSKPLKGNESEVKRATSAWWENYEGDDYVAVEDIVNEAIRKSKTDQWYGNDEFGSPGTVGRAIAVVRNDLEDAGYLDTPRAAQDLTDSIKQMGYDGVHYRTSFSNQRSIGSEHGDYEAWTVYDLSKVTDLPNPSRSPGAGEQKDIVASIKNTLNEKGSVDLTPIIELGHTIWNEGAQSLESFTTRAKELLGEAWDKVKNLVKQAWDILNSERGSFSTKPKSLYEAVKKAGGIDPEYIKNYHNWSEDIKQYGLVNLTKKGGRSLDDLATELQSQGILDLTPDEYASPGDYLLSELKKESQRKRGLTIDINELTDEEKAAIKELETEWHDQGLALQDIEERRRTAYEVFQDQGKENRLTKEALEARIEEKLRQLKSVIPTSKVKSVIRRNTGQTNLSKLVYEDEALNAAFKKAAQAARIAFREGNREGIEKQKAIMKEALKQAQQRAAEKAQKEKDIKTIQKLAEMKGDIAVDYQKKIKELMTGFDFKNITAQKWKELQGLKDYIDREGVPLGIKPKRIAELSRLTDINVNDLTPEQIGELKEQLKTLTQLGKLKANLKYKYKAREHARILNEIKETTNNIDPKVDMEKDRMRDKTKLFAQFYYLDVLHTPRVMEMFDNYKENGPQLRLMKMKGQAETRVISAAMKDSESFVKFLKDNNIDTAHIEEESFVRMSIVMRYREGARTQAQSLMDHYKIKDLPTLTEQEEKIIKYFKDYWEANKAEAAAVWEEVKEEIFPEQDVYYMPLKYVGDEELIPEYQTEGRGRTTHTFDGYGHARRQGVKKLPRVDLFNVFTEGILEQKWFIELQPVIDDIKSVVLTDDYKNAAGEVQYDYWKTDLDIMSRRGWTASAQLNAASSFFRFVRHNLNQAVLGFKASTFFIQPFAVFDGMAYVNAKRGPVVAGKVLTEVTKSFLIPGTTKEIVEKSAALQQRQGGELAITEEMERAKGQTVKEKLSRGAFRLISYADVKTAAGVQEAVRKVFVEDGMSEDEALKEAEFVMHMSQGSSSIAYRPHILARGEGARTWFTFQTFIMNRWGILVHDLLIGKIVKDTFIKKLNGLVSIGILIMAGATEDEAREWLYNLTHRKDLKKDNRSIPEKVLVELMADMPALGTFLESASKHRNADIPFTRSVSSMASGAWDLIFGKDAKARAKGSMKLSEGFLTIFVGLPGTAQFFDLLEGALIKEKPKRR